MIGNDVHQISITSSSRSMLLVRSSAVVVSP